MPPFGRNCNVKFLEPPIRPAILGVRVRGAKMVAIEIVHTFLFDFDTYYRLILHRLAKIHSAAYRQTHRAIGIGEKATNRRSICLMLCGICLSVRDERYAKTYLPPFALSRA